jgi:hypothetical protein
MVSRSKGDLESRIPPEALRSMLFASEENRSLSTQNNMVVNAMAYASAVVWLQILFQRYEGDVGDNVWPELRQYGIFLNGDAKHDLGGKEKARSVVSQYVLPALDAGLSIVNTRGEPEDVLKLLPRRTDFGVSFDTLSWSDASMQDIAQRIPVAKEVNGYRVLGFSSKHSKRFLQAMEMSRQLAHRTPVVELYDGERIVAIFSGEQAAYRPKDDHFVAGHDTY